MLLLGFLLGIVLVNFRYYYELRRHNKYTNLVNAIYGIYYFYKIVIIIIGIILLGLILIKIGMDYGI